MSVIYTDPTLVTDQRQTDQPAYGRSASGYGGKIPTRHMIRYAGKWRRVYVMCYSNSGTAYVIVNGTDTVLDIDTEYRLQSEGE
jgi:hypothetical protein